MALIICDNCGKKVSDTVERCIHCGAEINPTLESCCDSNPEAEAPAKEPEPPKSRRDYTFYSNDERIALEKEFLDQDKWAKKFRRTEEELGSFVKAALTSFCWVIVVLIVSFKIDESLMEKMFMLSPGREIFLVCAVLLALFLLTTLICTTIVKIRLKVTFAKYIYMKKYQAWLDTEKMIDYIPPISTIKEKNTLDSIDLNSLNF